MSTDWYPRSRDEQLHMVYTWLQVFQTKASAWNIPPANVTSLTTAETNAKNILAVVKSGERTAAEPTLRGKMHTCLLCDHLGRDWRDIIPTIKIPTLVLMGGAAFVTARL